MMKQKFELRKATRRKAKLRIGLAGPSGSGKTYSALLIASGMTTWDKVAVIDTENGSVDLYEKITKEIPDINGGHESFNVITLTAPFSPERYIEAIHTCEKAGMEVIIIDSVTHEWDGKGGCLEIVEQLTQASSNKNSYTAWGKVTPRHNAFIQKILQSPCHIMTTVRKKQDYDMVKNDKGKTEIVKVGLKEITREGFEYELTLALDLAINHYTKASKDRTGLFMDQPEFLIDKSIGEILLAWSNEGDEALPPPPEAPITPPRPAMIRRDQNDQIFDLWLKVVGTEDPTESEAIKVKTLKSLYKIDSVTKLTEIQAENFIQKLLLKKQALDAKRAQEELPPSPIESAPEPQVEPLDLDEQITNSNMVQAVLDVMGGEVVNESSITPIIPLSSAGVSTQAKVEVEVSTPSVKAWEKKPPEEIAKKLSKESCDQHPNGCPYDGHYEDSPL